MTSLSTEVAEAVRLRDAATPGSWAVQDSVYVVAGCWPLGSTICEVIENEPNAALIAAAPSHVDLIVRLHNALKATQDAYVETSAALTLEQDRNEGLHARVRELEALIRTIDDALSE